MYVQFDRYTVTIVILLLHSYKIFIPNLILYQLKHHLRIFLFNFNQTFFHNLISNSLFSFSVFFFLIFFVARCLHLEFNNERVQLHEYIFPELQRHCAQLGLDLLIVDANWQYTSDATPLTISSTTQPTATSLTTISTTQRSTTPKQQSVCNATISNATSQLNQQQKPANRTTSLPLSVDANSIQITESNYIEQILSTSKDFLDPNLFALELDEIKDCYHQSMYVFFLVSYYLYYLIFSSIIIHLNLKVFTFFIPISCSSLLLPLLISPYLYSFFYKFFILSLFLKNLKFRFSFPF